MVLLPDKNALPELLQSLPERDPLFRQALRTRVVSQGNCIATPDGLNRHLFLLIRGEAQLVCTTDEGRRLVVSKLKEGSVFGAGSLLRADNPNICAEALDDCLVWILPDMQAALMTNRHPILGWSWLQTMGERLQQVEDSLEDIAYKKLPQRLAAALLDMAGDGAITLQGISHRDLADRLGTYRETVSTILSDFRAKGLIEVGYRRISILNLAGLEHEAGIE